MRRLVVQPRLFGTAQGYNWDKDSHPEPHNDYCQLYEEYSVRVWEPTRMTLSTPGVYNGSTGPDAFEGPQLPTRAHIRGIKGDCWIRFDGTAEGVGEWLWPSTAAAGLAGTPMDPQPDWLSTLAALSGRPMGAGIDYDNGSTLFDYNPGFYIPVFCALYRGTYKAIDGNPGWEIDSGPADDPDVLLPLDITSPDVIESGRLDWWALDQVRAPHNTVAYAWDNVAEEYRPALQGPSGGSHHRFSLNLDSNKRVASDQVLWLHWKTGVIKLPVRYPNPSQAYVTCGVYRNHKFTVHVQASMLVDTAVSVA